MTFAGQILLALLVLLAFVTLIRLGSPLSYKNRQAPWYLTISAWASLLFDGAFLLAVIQFTHGTLAAALLLVFLGGRVLVALWLLKMVWNAKGEVNSTK